MAMLFARIQADVPLKLRRGAWYRVLHLTDLQAVIEVNRRPVGVLRAWLEIKERPPLQWSVVSHPQQSRKTPPELRGIYGVCPSCRARQALPKRARMLTCARCRGEFAIDLTEPTAARA
jgi:hypothetical protein